MNDNNTHRNPFRAVSRWFAAVARVFSCEWYVILRDFGVMLFFIALPLLYPLVYTLIYNPEIVTEMPVAVVDNSRTPASRHLVQLVTASPSISLYDYCNDMNEAKKLYASNEVFGILEIPADYSKRIARGEQATVPFYAEMSLLLRYRAFISALTEVQLKLATEITKARLDATGLDVLGIGGLPVEQHNNFLGDPGQGFASFVMPGIIILILQQSMVLGICMLSGTARERRRRNGGIDPMAVEDAPVSATIWGKALTYVVLYIPLALYVVRFVPEIFSLPHQGSPIDYLLFIGPLLLASAMFGLTLQGFCTERESAFPAIVVTSVVFLFLSGLTWPRYAMNGFFTWLGNMVPATWGVEGFIRINSNGATLAETSYPYMWLWILVGVYFLGAMWVMTRQRKYLCKV
ncbi:MAG: ABC transporter permease [Odoribacter sp.]|nr:ABC transporter permease [Odoribacter sp.]